MSVPNRDDVGGEHWSREVEVLIAGNADVCDTVGDSDRTSGGHNNNSDEFAQTLDQRRHPSAALHSSSVRLSLFARLHSVGALRHVPTGDVHTQRQ